MLTRRAEVGIDEQDPLVSMLGKGCSDVPGDRACPLSRYRAGDQDDTLSLGLPEGKETLNDAFVGCGNRAPEDICPESPLRSDPRWSLCRIEVSLEI